MSDEVALWLSRWFFVGSCWRRRFNPAVPLLVYIVGVGNPHIAIGTSAVAVAANAATNLLHHARSGKILWRCALVFAGTGVVGAYIGSTLGKMVDG
jgi:uncharacterized membrane protein YfcA